jgi:hypothetical protein
MVSSRNLLLITKTRFGKERSELPHFGAVKVKFYLSFSHAAGGDLPGPAKHS